MTLLSLSALVLLLPTATNADTTVTVLELGKGGVVRRTTSPSSHSTVSGVSSLWSSLHDTKARGGLQQPGMILVPDFFERPDGGLVVGISGRDLDLSAMPTVSALWKEEGGEGSTVVGHMELSGAQGQKLVARSFDKVTGDLREEARNVATNVGERKNQVRAVSVDIDGKEAAKKFDADLAAAIETLRKGVAKGSGSTVLVHLVVDRGNGNSRRRLQESREGGRRLEDEDKDEEEEDQDDANADDANNNNQYAGSGYYNDYGEWVTNYRTAFQIQYFNVVLWTTLGLSVVLFSAVGMMIYMPLMPDTLLFGESAKFTGA